MTIAQREILKLPSCAEVDRASLQTRILFRC
jgi:hypothetical protein